MTNWANLTENFFEDFFNLKLSKSVHLKPSNSIRRQLWRWWLRLNTTVVVKTSSSLSSKAKRSFRRVRHQCHRNCPQRGILTPVCFGQMRETIRVIRNFNCRIKNPVLIENLGVEKLLLLWKASAQNRRYDNHYKLQGKKSSAYRREPRSGGTGIRGQLKNACKINGWNPSTAMCTCSSTKSMKLLAQDQMASTMMDAEISSNQPWRVENPN